jgi:hypothetical protein
MTSYDITYCCSHTCPSRATCRRAHPPQDRVVPVSNFYKPNDSYLICQYYWSMSEFGMPTFKGGGKCNRSRS